MRPASKILRDIGWEARDDAHEDDQRNAVANAAAGDLFADPHQQDRAARQRDHGGEAEEHPGIDHHASGMLEADGDAERLKRGEATVP